ncbi:putative Protein Z [Corchorus capsularis]|uniref:Uncharacterized protein n=1 Tax=Corchorus capsularis TaxID=210143 RepID=A0A1R3GAY0_COCAP|nr:putative Protein Z [Corchorus capsularis]
MVRWLSFLKDQIYRGSHDLRHRDPETPGEAREAFDFISTMIVQAKLNKLGPYAPEEEPNIPKVQLAMWGRTLEQLFDCLGSRSIKDLNSQSSQMTALASSADESSGFGRVSRSGMIQNSHLLMVAWGRQGLKFKPSFQEIVAGFYNATANEVDYVN